MLRYTISMEKEKLPISADHLEKIKKWLGSGAINIFGLPFAGKDTHGRELSELFNAPLLSSGDAFRNAELDPNIKKILDDGVLPPSDIFFEVFTPYLTNPDYNNRPLILSSVGRWIGEEQGVIEIAKNAGHPIKAVIYLTLDEDKVHQRFEKSREIGDRGDRADDEAHKLDTRIEEFKNKTMDVLHVYDKMGLLIEINSDAQKEEVLKSILARLFVIASSESSNS